MARANRGGRAAGGNEGHPQLEQQITETPGADWTDAFHAHVLSTALDQIRPHFEEPTWNAFDRVWLQEKSSADAAQELSMPLEAVYVAKSRVLKRLREKVLELAEEIPSSIARP
jgi:RNA polymerase sigma-70 factor (ECF subfamily)